MHSFDRGDIITSTTLWGTTSFLVLDIKTTHDTLPHAIEYYLLQNLEHYEPEARGKINELATFLIDARFQHK
jgi:hypothetical protein